MSPLKKPRAPTIEERLARIEAILADIQHAMQSGAMRATPTRYYGLGQVTPPPPPGSFALPTPYPVPTRAPVAPPLSEEQTDATQQVKRRARKRA